MNDHESVIVDELPPCDICIEEGRQEMAAVDGKTVHGPWANMCPEHYAQFGVGLGLGRGQQLILRSSKAGKAVER